MTLRCAPVISILWWLALHLPPRRGNDSKSWIPTLHCVSITCVSSLSGGRLIKGDVIFVNLCIVFEKLHRRSLLIGWDPNVVIKRAGNNIRIHD